MGKERNVPWEEILRRRKEGETARALAEEFGVSVESVYKRGGGGSGSGWSRGAACSRRPESCAAVQGAWWRRWRIWTPRSLRN